VVFSEIHLGASFYYPLPSYRLKVVFDAMAFISPSVYWMPVANRSHAVSVQMPAWQAVCDISLGDIRPLNELKNGYPRSYVHKSVQEVCFSPISF
jgi:hypothetical protein